MTAHEILALRPRIQQFLRLFDGCFVNEKTRHHLRVYVQGQLSNLLRKSVEPIALACGIAARTLQVFLKGALWDQSRLRDLLQRHLAASPELGPAADRRNPPVGQVHRGVGPPSARRL